MHFCPKNLQKEWIFGFAALLLRKLTKRAILPNFTHKLRQEVSKRNHQSCPQARYVAPRARDSREVRTESDTGRLSRALPVGSRILETTRACMTESAVGRDALGIHPVGV